MGLRDMLRRSARALFDEVKDRVLERADTTWPRRPKPRRDPAPRDHSAAAPTTPRRAAPAPTVTAGPGPDVSVTPGPGPDVTLASRAVSKGRDAETDEAPKRIRDEPILTRTMAGVLAAQGYHERAVRIYDHLLTKTPGDSDLASEAETVRTRLAEGEGPPEDEVAAVPVKREALLVSWKVTSRSIERARKVLGGEGTLAARLVVVARDRGAHVRSDTLEHGPIDDTGEHLFPSIPLGARCTASVGLRAGDRFVSVAHSRVVPT